MAKTVREIMSRDLLSLRASDSTQDALGFILALGVMAAPVLGADDELVGMVSVRDIAAHPRAERVADCMSPFVCVWEGAAIGDAARVLGETDEHQAVVVDAEGDPVGIVSALDVIRGIVGLPASWHAVGLQYDRETGVTFSDDMPFEEAAVESAPDGPGVLVLVTGGRDRAERVAWSESSTDVRARLRQLITRPDDHEGAELRHLLGHPSELRFRFARVQDPEARRRVVRALMSRTIADRAVGQEAHP